MSNHAGPRRLSSTLGVYVVLLISLQIFLVSVAVDALQTDDETLAWTAAGISVLLAAAAVLFARYLRRTPTS
jgi:hypothetical protein